jgi:hypothetical protein
VSWNPFWSFGDVPEKKKLFQRAWNGPVLLESQVYSMYGRHWLHGFGRLNE